VVAAVALTSAGPAPAVGNAVSDERRLAAQLDQVEREILAGEFDKARRHLDGMARDLDGYAGLKSRADASRTRIAVASTLGLAQRLEKDDNVPAALSAYRDILAIEPHHAEARTSIARLMAAIEKAEAEAAPVVPVSKPSGTRPRPSGGRPEAKPAG